MVTENINIDVRPGGIPIVIHVTQYEVGLRKFVFTPYTSNGTQTVVAGSATLEGTKPDGYAFQQACEMIDGVITYTLQEQLCAVDGRVWSRLVIRDTDGGMIGYTAIVWVVGRAGVADDAVMSDSDISALRQFLDEFGTIDAYRGALNGALAAVGGPLVAATASAMTDTTKVYVYTGSETGYTSGHWYYWNGSAWTDGGVYQSTGINTDITLTVEGMAADAKATGDAVAELKNELSEINGSEELTGWVTDYYIDLSGNTVDLNNPSKYVNQYRYLVADCTPGESFIINGRGGSSPRLWGFIDSSNNVIRKALSSAVGVNLILTAPENAVKLIINDNMTGGICYRGKPLQMIVSENSNGIKNLEQVDSFIGKYGLGEVYCASVRDAYPNDGYYVSATGVKTGGASYHVCGFFPISTFADYTLVYSSDFVSTAYPVGAFGADGTFLGTYPTTAPSETGVNNIKISDVAELYPTAKFFVVTESAVTAILTTGVAEKGSLFPVDLSVSFAAETDRSYNSDLLGSVSLGAGRYILKWVQETDTRKNILDSRLCPVYVNSSNVATYYHLTVENVVWDAGERYWIIDIETAGIYRFYFWGKQLTEAVTISGINLYSADSELGKIYLNKAEMQSKEDALMAYPSMFTKIGFLGDSWTAGSLYNAQNEHVVTDFSISYASQMCRIMGSTPTSFAKGGLSAREWVSDTDIGLPVLLASPKQDLYWINFGINDAGEIGGDTGETAVGDPDDYDNDVSGTFCYYMGQIISSIKTYSPESRIVICDIMQRSLYMVKIANVLPAICEYYEVPLVRMYDDQFYRNVKTANLLVGGHPTVALHSGMAIANIRLLSKCIRNSSAYFNEFLPISAT